MENKILYISLWVTLIISIIRLTIDGFNWDIFAVLILSLLALGQNYELNKFVKEVNNEK